MSSKRRERRKSCEGKRRFDTMQAAIMACIALRKVGSFQSPYKCHFCKYWHTGHKPAWLKRKLAQRHGG